MICAVDARKIRAHCIRKTYLGIFFVSKWKRKKCQKMPNLKSRTIDCKYALDGTQRKTRRTAFSEMETMETKKMPDHNRMFFYKNINISTLCRS
jgi:hypothetical protein